MAHKRSAEAIARRMVKRNLFAAKAENLLGTEAGRRVTTIWFDDKKQGLIPVAFVDEALLKPERMHGGTLNFRLIIDRRKGHAVHLVGSMPLEDELTTKAVNKRASRLSQDHRRR